MLKQINDDLFKLFKPFGLLNYDIGRKNLNEVYVLDKSSKQPILRLSGREGTMTFKAAVVGKMKNITSTKIIESYIKAQVNQFQSCIGCSACDSICKFNAIKVLNTQKGNVSNNTINYSINENNCVGCLECVRHFDNGCYMSKVLRTRKDSNNK